MLFSIKQVLDAVENKSSVSFSDDILQAAFKQRQEKMAAKYVDICMEFIDRVERQIETVVNDLKEIRKRERVMKDRKDRLNRAALYFDETKNMLPFVYESFSHLGSEVGWNNVLSFCRQYDLVPPDAEDKLHLIPSDWEPKVVNKI